MGDATGITVGSVSGPELDTTMKASGASALRFTIPPNAGSDPSGSYFANFSDDRSVLIDGNGEFFIQWRQRFSTEFISTVWRQDATSYTAPKQIIVGTGDLPGCTRSNTLNLEDYPGTGFCAYSCTALETVVTRNYSLTYPIMYNSCTGSSSHRSPYHLFAEPFAGSDFKLQNGRPAPFCTYQLQSDGTHGNCFEYFPNEWMTFQVRVKTGPRVNDEFANSVVQLWIAREGRPSELVIDWGNTSTGHPAFNLSAGPPALLEKFGKVWLLPYMTNKWTAQANPTARTWYDELIISRQHIADP